MFHLNWAIMFIIKLNKSVANAPKLGYIQQDQTLYTMCGFVIYPAHSEKRGPSVSK